MRQRDLWTGVAVAAVWIALAAIGDARHPQPADVFYLVVSSALLYVAVRRLRYLDSHWWEF